MSLPLDLVAQVAWSEGAGRWYWTAGSGQTGFVSETVIRNELLAQQAAMKSALETLTGQVYAGELSVAEWEAAVALEIKNAALAQAMFANGGAANMGAAEFGRVGGFLQDQYKYLNNFALGIADGSVSEGQAVVRVGMYGDSTEAAYWQAWGANRPGGDIADLPLLPTHPRSGDTQCLSNCLCSVKENDDGSVDWVLDGGEHCPDCVELANGGPYRAN